MPSATSGIPLVYAIDHGLVLRFEDDGWVVDPTVKPDVEWLTQLRAHGIGPTEVVAANTGPRDGDQMRVVPFGLQPEVGWKAPESGGLHAEIWATPRTDGDGWRGNPFAKPSPPSGFSRVVWAAGKWVAGNLVWDGIKWVVKHPFEVPVE